MMPVRHLALCFLNFSADVQVFINIYCFYGMKSQNLKFPPIEALR